MGKVNIMGFQRMNKRMGERRRRKTKADRRRRGGRGLYFEALEERRLMSATFAYDLRFAPGQEGESADGHTVDLSQAHQSTYTLELWGQITGEDDNLSNDVFSCGYVSIASDQVNGYGALAGGGITSGQVNTKLFHLLPYNASAAVISDDGVMDWGTADPGNNAGWMFWSNCTDYTTSMGYESGTYIPGESEPAASDPEHTWEVLIATFTVDASDIAAQDLHGRITNFNVALPANQVVSGVVDVVARADGTTDSINTAQIGAGASFVLPATDRSVNDFSRALAANTAAGFTANDFAQAFSDGPYGGSMQAVEITALPAHGALLLGSAAVTAGELLPPGDLANLVYVPDANYVGADTFGWNATDGAGFAGTDGEVNLTVNADPAPVIGNVPVQLGQNARSHAFSGAEFAEQFSDAVAGDSLDSVVILSLPVTGMLTLYGMPVLVNQRISIADLSGLAYTAGSSFEGEDAFNWAAIDGTGITSNTAAVTCDGPVVTPPAEDASASSPGAGSNAPANATDPPTGGDNGPAPQPANGQNPDANPPVQPDPLPLGALDPPIAISDPPVVVALPRIIMESGEFTPPHTMAMRAATSAAVSKDAADAAGQFVPASAGAGPVAPVAGAFAPVGALEAPDPITQTISPAPSNALPQASPLQGIALFSGNPPTPWAAQGPAQQSAPPAPDSSAGPYAPGTVLQQIYALPILTGPWTPIVICPIEIWQPITVGLLPPGTLVAMGAVAVTAV